MFGPCLVHVWSMSNPTGDRACVAKTRHNYQDVWRRPVTQTLRNYHDDAQAPCYPNPPKLPPYTMRHTRKHIFFSTARRRCVLAVALRLTLLATRPDSNGSGSCCYAAPPCKSWAQMSPHSPRLCWRFGGGAHEPLGDAARSLSSAQEDPADGCAAWLDLAA